ncbi:uncharacterized protein METZ01_LOCUS150879, partial [marine metagenome]
DIYIIIAASPNPQTNLYPNYLNLYLL